MDYFAMTIEIGELKEIMGTMIEVTNFTKTGSTGIRDSIVIKEWESYGVISKKPYFILCLKFVLNIEFLFLTLA